MIRRRSASMILTNRMVLTNRGRSHLRNRHKPMKQRGRTVLAVAAQSCCETAAKAKGAGNCRRLPSPLERAQKTPASFQAQQIISPPGIDVSRSRPIPPRLPGIFVGVVHAMALPRGPLDPTGWQRRRCRGGEAEGKTGD